MKFDEPLWRWSATDLHRGYRDGSVTPLDAVQSCLDRIKCVNPLINAFVAMRDGVLDDAEESSERFRMGKPLSVLDGIPLSIKDNLCTADMPTTWGTPSLAGYRSPSDELPVARVRSAGALLVGKTNVPEFTLEGYTGNPLFGITRNPWNLTLTPGGSSGGAVASVAAGCTPLALGTDGGGSIRRPASHCGLVGFKPSTGAVARGGGLPSLLLDFEVVGPMGRSVADARLLFDVIRGPSPTDRGSLAAAGATLQPQPYTRCQALRILWVPDLDAAPVDPEIDRHFLEAAESFRQLGHSVHVANLPLNLLEVSRSWSLVGQIGLAALFARHPEWRDAASSKYRAMAEQGEALSAATLWVLQSHVERLREDCARLFMEWDIVAMPSAAALPWPAENAHPCEIAGHPVGPRGHAVFTGWVNAAGLPAISVPVHPSDSGMPIGMQLIGAYGADDVLLDLADTYEKLAPWKQRRPEL